MIQRLIVITIMGLMLASCSPKEEIVDGSQQVDTQIRDEIETLNSDDLLVGESEEEITTTVIGAESEIDQAQVVAESDEVELTAKELNSLGYDLYKEKKYEQALAYFKQSFDKDENYYYPHYNYACTLGVLMKLDYPMWYEYRQEVHEHLRIVVDLKPDYLAKIEVDEDLDLFRKDFEYLGLFGYGIDKDSDIDYILKHLNWYMPGPGVITTIGYLTFDELGGFELSFLDVSKMDEGNYDFPIHGFTGTYEVVEGLIHFEFDASALTQDQLGVYIDRTQLIEGKRFQGQLLDGGMITIPILSDPLLSHEEEFSA